MSNYLQHLNLQCMHLTVFGPKKRVKLVCKCKRSKMDINSMVSPSTRTYKEHFMWRSDLFSSVTLWCKNMSFEIFHEQTVTFQIAE